MPARPTVVVLKLRVSVVSKIETIRKNNVITLRALNKIITGLDLLVQNFGWIKETLPSALRIGHSYLHDRVDALLKEGLEQCKTIRDAITENQTELENRHLV
jgi:hypothetical protein